LTFSAISFLAWHTADRSVTEPEADSATVLVHDASDISVWECFSPGSGAAGCSEREHHNLPAGV